MLNPLRSSIGSRICLAVVASSVFLVASAGVVAAGANDGALRVSPDPTVQDLHAQPWDHITIAGNGKRLVVYFWMGPQACNGLGRVNVGRHNGQVHVRLWTGIPPHSRGMVCPEYAQLYKTVVHLNRPIILSDVS